ncbi:unnamed protein product [Meloidogyne enterolobii]|uniref:Uncharacterized protein n=1 Tax=Meloidogyne enterolobii TaxID=390850 RepID=A0ACB0YNL0_MELEN
MPPDSALILLICTCLYFSSLFLFFFSIPYILIFFIAFIFILPYFSLPSFAWPFFFLFVSLHFIFISLFLINNTNNCPL